MTAGTGRCAGLSVLAEVSQAVWLAVFVAALPLQVSGNPVENPSMEGSFVSQDPFGNVAAHWTAWNQRASAYAYEGEFLENTDPNEVHEGNKSQEILWEESHGRLGSQDIGWDGMFQQIDALQPGNLYRASVWFTGQYLGLVGPPPNDSGVSMHLTGSIGVDPDGGASPDAVGYWVWEELSEVYAYPERPDVLPWCQRSVVFSPSETTATVFIRMSGWISHTGYRPDPTTGEDYPVGLPWELAAYIDDVLVESAEIGPGSTVEATSPVAANGIDRSKVTITVLDASGEPLSGFPDSEVVVECTGSNNTISQPSSNDLLAPNHTAVAYISSRTAGTKTVSVTVLGRPLADTAVIEFTGSFGPIWYVDADATGANNGSSWADAFNDLQDGLAAAQSGDEVRIACGLYAPGAQRTDAFQLKNGVTVRGGYAGFGEPDPNARDTSGYPTVLTGDLNGDDGLDFANNGDNSHHVLIANGNDATAILDGFTITAGNADGSSGTEPAGGGMYVYTGSPRLTDCTFSANTSQFGAGLMNYSASPTVTSCIFTANYARTGGGGMANDENAAPTVTDCEFTGNSSEYGLSLIHI